jgi:hypothetical protein
MRAVPGSGTGVQLPTASHTAGWVENPAADSSLPAGTEVERTKDVSVGSAMPEPVSLAVQVIETLLATQPLGTAGQKTAGEDRSTSMV